MIQGIEQALYVCYGNHPKASSVKRTAEKAIVAVSKVSFMPRPELFDVLGLKEKNPADKAKFHRVMSPLCGNNPLRITFVWRHKIDGGRWSYSLSEDGFLSGMNNLKSNWLYVVQKFGKGQLRVGGGTDALQMSSDQAEG